jgi:hypothetical protein
MKGVGERSVQTEHNPRHTHSSLCPPVSPRVVVLCIHFKHLVTKVQFPISAAQPLYHGPTVVPNLIILGIVATEAVQVIELFVQV